MGPKVSIVDDCARRRTDVIGSEKVFIAAMFYNNGGVLPYWITQITRLIYYLGPVSFFPLFYALRR